MKQIFLLLCLFTISSISFAQITNLGTGNWSSPGTWDGGTVPGASDNVVIASGTTVTIDGNYNCSNLTIHGTLQFPDDGTSYNSSVYADLTVASDGSLIPAPSATHTGTSWFYVYGNLVISGNFSGHLTSGRTIVIYMDGAGKYIDAPGKTIFSLVIDVAGSSINVNGSFTISNVLSLNGTLNNSAHNITIGSYATIYRNSSSAILTAAPIFADYNSIVRYQAAMTTGNELNPNLNSLYVSISAGGSVTLDKGIALSYLYLGYANDKLITGSNTVIVNLSGSISQADNTAYVVGNLEMVYPASPASLTFPIGSNSAYRPVTINTTAVTGGGTITISQIDAAPGSSSLPSGVNKISGVRYWTLTPSSGMLPMTADVTLSWGSDDGVSDASAIKVVHGDHSTGNWDVANNTGGHTGTAPSGTVTGTAFTSFGDFTLGTTGSDVLPVELVAFTAQPTRSAVTLNWTTATETNNFGYEIERRLIVNGSQQSSGWTSAGFVQGKGTSTSPTQYSFTDDNLTAGRYAYRLQQIDRNGSFIYSAAVEVQVGLTAKEFRLGQNYPNPFNPTTTIEFALQEDGHVVLKLYDVTGRELATLLDEERKAGYNQSVAVDMSRFGSGVYFYRLEANGKLFTRKMLVVK